MKGHFKPNGQRISALHKAADQLEDMLDPFFDKLKGFKSASLSVQMPNWNPARSRIDVLTDEWHAHYSGLVQDCEVCLTANISRKVFSSVTSKDYCKARLTKLPGCCGACVINKVEIHPELRGNGIGKAFIKVLEAFARSLDYSCLIATVEKFNCQANAIASCLGFTRSDQFTNTRTNNTVIVYVKDINPDGIPLTDGYDKGGQ